MARVIHGGTDVFNALVYGDRHPNHSNFFQNQFESFNQLVGDAGRVFIDRAKQVYDSVYGSEAMRHARAALRKIENIFQPNTIRSLSEIGQMQAASVTMQRWIMACPDVRELFHKQKCDGFSDSYVDVHPGKIGEDHYDYRRVMDGMVQEIETEDGEGDWMCVSFLDELVEGDRELNMDEQTNILSTWDMLRAMIKAPGGEDPTSIYGSSL